ncbi:MAG: hypothetical protein PW788_04815 [Micavibrio sp.]|nr:hypothetical protein [Micavibrio sp.]
MDTKPITQEVQEILRRQDAHAAVALVHSYDKANTAWLPEALCLFNVRSLLPAQKKQMLQNIFTQNIDDAAAEVLADICARTGRYGFAFPQWRFLSQGFNGKSLLEHYGFIRLARNNDVRDASLPPRDPARDEFGAGFVKTSGDLTVEYRRAYILCARHTAAAPAALVIRNSSYFFGRDRLPAPAYVAWENIPPAVLQNLNIENFGNKGLFQPLHNGLPLDKLQHLQTILDHMDAEDMSLSRWLTGQGQSQLMAFLAHMATIAPIHCAHIDPQLPPWFPLDEAADTKLVLLSGPSGDLPVGERKEVQKNK